MLFDIRIRNLTLSPADNPQFNLSMIYLGCESVFGQNAYGIYFNKQAQANLSHDDMREALGHILEEILSNPWANFIYLSKDSESFHEASIKLTEDMDVQQIIATIKEAIM